MRFSQWLNSHRIFKRLAKALTRPRMCAGWSEPLLVAYTSLLEISCHGSIIISSSTDTHGPRREKTCLRVFANKGADQPAHPRSLTSAFVFRLLEIILSILATSKISIF